MLLLINWLWHNEIVLIEAYHLKKPKGNMSKKILLKIAKFPVIFQNLLLLFS